jgi:hypothetical protein
MAAGDPDVTVLDRELRLSLLARSGSDSTFLGLVDQALATALKGGDSARAVPEILHLSLLRGALADDGPRPALVPATPRRTGVPPATAAPFAAEGEPCPGDEHEDYLRDLRARWVAHAGRHLYPTPAAWLHSLLPPAPLPGNPHSLARLLRVLVTHLAPADCRAATTLACLIEDSGEAAVAQCALVGAALATHDLDAEAQTWSLQRQLLTRMPTWTWPGGRADHDQDVLAYLRPDHRARFDTAVGVLPFATGLGHALLTGLPALSEIHRGAHACHGSLEYTEHRLAGRRPTPEAAALHEEARRAPATAGSVPPGSGPATAGPIPPGSSMPPPHRPDRRRSDLSAAAERRGDLLSPAPPIVAAVVSAHEQILGGAELPIGDPVYRLFARITARTARAHRLGADDLTPEPVPEGFDPQRLPAYAEIVRQNADSPIVAALAGRVSAEATARDDREALLILADAGYADPDQVLDGPPVPIPEWSALMFRHRPDEAVRRLSEAALKDWTLAAAMLEHAAAELLAAAGSRVAHELHDAVVRAAGCTAPPDTDPPTVVDGAYT